MAAFSRTGRTASSDSARESGAPATVAAHPPATRYASAGEGSRAIRPHPPQTCPSEMELRNVVDLDGGLSSHSSVLQDQLREEREQKLPRPCLFPPINAPQNQMKEREDSGQITLYEERRRLEEKCLLAELTRIEQELRDKLRREQERQEELDRVRQEENRQRWKSLCYMSFNQRINKPWVFSFYKNFPMHIYCLPIQTVSHRNGKKKKKFKR